MRHRKGNFLDTMMRIAAFQQKAREEESRELHRFRRGAFYSAILLTIINSLLLLDMYVLPFKVSTDRVDEIVMRQVKGTLSYKMNTAEGRHIFLAPGAWVNTGDTLVFEESFFFSVPKTIVNKYTGYAVPRAFEGYMIARVCAVIFFIAGAGALLSRRYMLGNNYIILISLMIMAVAQAVLLIL